MRISKTGVAGLITGLLLFSVLVVVTTDHAVARIGAFYFTGLRVEQDLTREFSTGRQLEAGERNGFYALAGEVYRTAQVDAVLDEAMQGRYDDLPITEPAQDRLRAALTAAAPTIARSDIRYAGIVSYLRDWRRIHDDSQRILQQQLGTYSHWLTAKSRLAGFPTGSLQVDTGCTVLHGDPALQQMTAVAHRTGHQPR